MRGETITEGCSIKETGARFGGLYIHVNKPAKTEDREEEEGLTSEVRNFASR